MAEHGTTRTTEDGSEVWCATHDLWHALADAYHCQALASLVDHAPTIATGHRDADADGGALHMTYTRTIDQVFTLLCHALDNGRPVRILTARARLPRSFVLSLYNNAAGAMTVHLGTEDGTEHASVEIGAIESVSIIPNS